MTMMLVGVSRMSVRVILPGDVVMATDEGVVRVVDRSDARIVLGLAGKNLHRLVDVDHDAASTGDLTLDCEVAGDRLELERVGADKVACPELPHPCLVNTEERPQLSRVV